MKRPLIIGAVLAGAFVLTTAGTAGATVTGSCSGTINGVDVGPLSSSDPNDAVDVQSDQDITVAATAPGGIDRYKIKLEFAGIKWTVSKGTADNDSWSKVVNVSDYARYGVGLYRVHGVSTGSSSCTGSALVNVDGNPLTTIAGIAGSVMLVAGGAGVVGATLRARGSVT